MLICANNQLNQQQSVSENNHQVCSETIDNRPNTNTCFRDRTWRTSGAGLLCKTQSGDVVIGTYRRTSRIHGQHHDADSAVTTNAIQTGHPTPTHRRPAHPPTEAEEQGEQRHGHDDGLVQDEHWQWLGVPSGQRTDARRRRTTYPVQWTRTKLPT